MSRAKESVRRLMETIDKGGKVEWARKTRFIPQRDGSLRRLVQRKDGTVEKDEIISEDRMLVAEARAKTGLSQDKFAALLGISARTLRDWEQGRRTPSGAAKTLLQIAAKHPDVLQEVV
ncbi:MAG: helix-turn-helix domain-containing protein [Nitrospiraceae bacterium]|nr:helix-turn-helix domain-containing protein [Nitrospiraceae bacterium]